MQHVYIRDLPHAFSAPGLGQQSVAESELLCTSLDFGLEEVPVVFAAARRHSRSLILPALYSMSLQSLESR